MATVTQGLRGLNTVLRNLNRELGNMKQRSHAGLLAGGYVVLRDAQKRVPVDTGNLKGSGYVRDLGVDKGVEVGFSASYAVYVHEDLEAHHNVGEAKFLEKSLSANQRRIRELIKSGGKG